MQNSNCVLLVASLLSLTACSSRVHYLEELDLTMLENSKHLSEPALFSYLKERCIVFDDHAFKDYETIELSPVMVCGVPCRLGLDGHVADSSKRSVFFDLDCYYDYFVQVSDTVKQRDDHYPQIARSKTALQDSFVSRLKAKYGDWDKWIPDTGGLSRLSPTVKLRTIHALLRPQNSGPITHYPLDTSVSISLYDSAHYVRHHRW
jgi:hypothetical protein